MMKNKVKEVVKNTLNEALRDQFETISKAVLTVNTKADKAKKLGTIGVIVGTGALIHSVMVGRQNVELVGKLDDMENEFGEAIDEMQDQIDDLVETVKEYDNQMKKMSPHECSCGGAATESGTNPQKDDEVEG